MRRTLFWIAMAGLFAWAAFAYPGFRWLYLLCGVLALSRVRRGRAADPLEESP